MNNWMKKHKLLTTLVFILVVMGFTFLFAGKTIKEFTLEQMIHIKSKDKEVCTINPQNATQIVYKGITYQILNETVENANIGGWTGVFRKVSVLDQNYRVLEEQKSKVDSISQIKEIQNNLPQGAQYIVAFFNVYNIKEVDEREAIVVNIDRGMYKAVPVDQNLKKELFLKISFLPIEVLVKEGEA